MRWNEERPLQFDARFFLRANTHTHMEEPHARRRKALLTAHPELRALQGVEWRTKYVCALLSVTQTAVACGMARASVPTLLFVAYAVGAPLAQALFLGLHELAHDLAFASPRANRALALWCVNPPLVFPVASSFRAYHLAHHRALGARGADVDLPSAWEERVLLRRAPTRALWAALQIVAYAVRPLLCDPRPLTRAHALNAGVQLAYVLALRYTCGAHALLYLLLSLLFAGGLHPCAGHFFTEHAAVAAPQETYSYYGPLNALTWNVGYHNEHHDLPRVPWSRLPRVRALAPEFYATLAQRDAWFTAAWTFVWDARASKRVAR